MSLSLHLRRGIFLYDTAAGIDRSSAVTLQPAGFLCGFILVSVRPAGVLKQVCYFAELFREFRHRLFCAKVFGRFRELNALFSLLPIFLRRRHRRNSAVPALFKG
jgi:hypothetical protein